MLNSEAMKCYPNAGIESSFCVPTFRVWPEGNILALKNKSHVGIPKGKEDTFMDLCEEVK